MEYILFLDVCTLALCLALGIAQLVNRAFQHLNLLQDIS